VICLVTGAAGFIGSHLVAELVATGWEVRAVDSITPYYDVAQKEANARSFEQDVPLERVDLTTNDPTSLLEGVDVIFHQAAQPGVRASWESFDSYVDANVRLTHRLLEAALKAGVSRLVYASSSSVYGNRQSYPTRETDLPAPVSPYGVTKLAGEHLCRLYAVERGLPTASLRYFTVYGPRQRPDMAMHRLIEAAVDGSSFPLYGDGSQIRDFTYVGDVVRANLKAATAQVPPGVVFNVAGGGATTLAEVISLVEELVGASIRLERKGDQAGDVFRTGGSAELAGELLGWEPNVPLAEGLSRQVEWHLDRRRVPSE
jgi:UDP-glucuronate 4-epimerase